MLIKKLKQLFQAEIYPSVSWHTIQLTAVSSDRANARQEAKQPREAALAEWAFQCQLNGGNEQRKTVHAAAQLTRLTTSAGYQAQRAWRMRKENCANDMEGEEKLDFHCSENTLTIKILEAKATPWWCKPETLKNVRHYSLIFKKMPYSMIFHNTCFFRNPWAYQDIVYFYLHNSI